MQRMRALRAGVRAYGGGSLCVCAARVCVRARLCACLFVRSCSNRRSFDSASWTLACSVSFVSCTVCTSTLASGAVPERGRRARGAGMACHVMRGSAQWSECGRPAVHSRAPATPPSAPAGTMPTRPCARALARTCGSLCVGARPSLHNDACVLRACLHAGSCVTAWFCMPLEGAWRRGCWRGRVRVSARGGGGGHLKLSLGAPCT